MNKKALILSLPMILAVFLLGGWLIIHRMVPISTTSVVPDVVSTVPEGNGQIAGQNRLQHIESIPGNSDEVWYLIPEMGVKMKLNRGFAEDLVYRAVYKNATTSEELDAVYFSTKALLDIDAGCSGSLGGMFLSKGQGVPEDNFGYYESESFGQIIFQFSESFVVWQGPQDVCWDANLEGKVRKVFPKRYSGLGAKSIREGMRTLSFISEN